MRYALALIVACCGLLAFSGCAKITGERIEFGHTYECYALRNKVYHITYSEDADHVRHLIRKVQNDCNNCDKDCLKPDKDNRRGCCSGHMEIMRALNNYREGFLGWF